MKPAVICGLPSEYEAEAIILSLKDAGFLNTDIWVLIPDNADIHCAEYEKHDKALDADYTCRNPAGLIMAILCGAAMGANAGGIAGGLTSLGMSEYDAKNYEGKLRDGHVLLSVHTGKSAEAKRAKEIFKAAGARDIKCTSE